MSDIQRYVEENRALKIEIEALKAKLVEFELENLGAGTPGKDPVDDPDYDFHAPQEF